MQFDEVVKDASWKLSIGLGTELSWGQPENWYLSSDS